MMISGKTKLYALVFLVVFTVYDILINQIFVQTGAWHLISNYYIATWLLLTPALIILFTAATKNLLFPLWTATFIYGGWLDILFFIFQLQPLPARYTWLPHQPTNVEIVVIASTLTVLVSMFENKINSLNAKPQSEKPEWLNLFA